MKEIKKPAVVIRNANDNGKKTFHPKRISWSYLYLGYATRAHIKKNKTSAVFKANHINPGTRENIPKSMGGYQPPRNRRLVRAHINSIFALSPKKNNAKPIAEYSTK